MSGISAILNLDGSPVPQSEVEAEVWNPDNIPDVVRFKHDHEYLEAFEERLHAAMKVRLRSRRVPCAIA
jgi:hypothetical protein